MAVKRLAEESLILLRSRLCDSLFLFSYLKDVPDSNYNKLKLIISSSIIEACNNSVLLLGPRGCGKKAILELVLKDLQKEYPDTLALIRLDGLLHSEDTGALKEIARQLCLKYDLAFSKMASFDENSQFLIAMLRECGLAHKTMIFVLDEFDLLTQGKQRLLYSLLDALSTLTSQAVIVGISCRLDTDQLLEKRVRSRFSHRKLLFVPPNREEMLNMLKHTLHLQEDSSFPLSYIADFNARVDAIMHDQRFVDAVSSLTNIDNSVAYMARFLFKVVCHINMESGLLSIDSFKNEISCIQRHPKLEALQEASVLELYILVCMNRLELKEQHFYNFNSVMKEYRALHDTYHTSDHYAQNICLRAFEHLIEQELIAFIDSRIHAHSIEFRSVKLLISSHELHQGLKLNHACPALLLKLLNHEAYR